MCCWWRRGSSIVGQLGNGDAKTSQKRLWGAADELRANSKLKDSEYSLPVLGLSGDVREGNFYYEDIHKSLNKFDFVMANPPFNVDRVDKERIKDDPRFGLRMPKGDNASYLWIQIFNSSE